MRLDNMPRTCQVMGIVNVTPDSFSDGGQYFRPEEAIRRAKNVVADGATIVDLGGESTRPGATPLDWESEWQRLEPVIAGLAGLKAVLSVDTYHPETAAKAVAAGVKIVNCVYAEPVPAMMEILKSTPGTELVLPTSAFKALPNAERTAFADRLYIDPMIGFGTTREEDLELLKSVKELTKLGRVLVGASRKRIVKKLTGINATGKLTGGNVAIALWSALQGASIVRVHEVFDTVQALKVLESLSA